MARLCEICGAVESGADESPESVIEFLYVCDTCRSERLG